MSVYLPLFLTPSDSTLPSVFGLHPTLSLRTPPYPQSSDSTLPSVFRRHPTLSLRTPPDPQSSDSCMGTCIFTTIPISIHLNFSSLFCMYQSIHTTNMYLSNTHTLSSSYFSYRQLPTYSMIHAIYYSMLGGPIYMISSCSHDVIISTF
jgi:hypothetical protein